MPYCLITDIKVEESDREKKKDRDREREKKRERVRQSIYPTYLFYWMKLNRKN